MNELETWASSTLIFCMLHVNGKSTFGHVHNQSTLFTRSLVSPLGGQLKSKASSGKALLALGHNVVEIFSTACHNKTAQQPFIRVVGKSIRVAYGNKCPAV